MILHLKGAWYLGLMVFFPTQFSDVRTVSREAHSAPSSSISIIILHVLPLSPGSSCSSGSNISIPPIVTSRSFPLFELLVGIFLLSFQYSTLSPTFPLQCILGLPFPLHMASTAPPSITVFSWSYIRDKDPYNPVRAVKQFSACAWLSLSNLLSRSRLLAKSARLDIINGLSGWRLFLRMDAAWGARSLDVPRVLAKDRATWVMLFPMKSIWKKGDG